jgi:3-deoxy-7-phosphoheptulonate synthase
MILLLDKKTQSSDVAQLLERLEWMGLRVNITQQGAQIGLAITSGADKTVDFSQFQNLPHVEKVLAFEQPYKLASRQTHPENSVFTIRGKTIGAEQIMVMAGPCSIESEQQILEAARCVAKSGANVLRAGAFKPRTSPYSFQGLGEEGLRYLQKAGEMYNLLTVSEVMDGDQIELVAQYVDILQIGARNMQNFSLLKKLGSVPNPILLKRGLSATYQDLLMSAEYILNAGNSQVILCERGIRTYETHSRNTLDLAAVPILKELTHLPIIVDPSHGTGIRKMVAPMARAAIAAGADGLMIEVHPEPDKALSDADQTLDPGQFDALMRSLHPLALAVGRTM